MGSRSQAISYITYIHLLLFYLVTFLGSCSSTPQATVLEEMPPFPERESLHPGQAEEEEGAGEPAQHRGGPAGEGEGAQFEWHRRA